MRRTIFCNHYRALSDHAACAAGVDYGKFKGRPMREWPCFCRTGQAPPGGCEAATFPTAEELAREEAEHEARFANVRKAREAIVAHLGPWKRGTPGVGGAIDCPVCGGRQTLCFSRAGTNGHVHARCDTKGCVSWIE